MNKFLETLKNLGWLGTAIVTLVAGIWLATTYFNEQRLAYSKSFSDKQLEIAYLAVDTVGGLVSARTSEKWEEYKSQFWNIYLGKLVLFETEDTASRMEALSRVLETTTFKERKTLRPYALHVSKSLRDFIAERNSNDWRMSFQKLIGL